MREAPGRGRGPIGCGQGSCLGWLRSWKGFSCQKWTFKDVKVAFSRGSYNTQTTAGLSLSSWENDVLAMAAEDGLTRANERRFFGMW